MALKQKIKDWYNSKKPIIKEWVETIVVATILALAIRTFIVQPFKIPTGSMKPTLIEQDRILVNRFIFGLRIPFSTIRIFKFYQPK